MLCSWKSETLLTYSQALEFGARKLWNVRFISILGLSSEKATPVNVKLEGAKWSIESASPGDQYKVYPLKVSSQL